MNTGIPYRRQRQTWARTLAAAASLCLWAGAPARAQSPEEIRRILERLDRLEEQNRALLAEVRDLKQEVALARAAPAGQPPAAEQTPPATEERLEVAERRTADLAQSKVEASQRFPIRVTGMALFNAFLNSKGSNGVEYPVTARLGSLGSGGATFRQTVIGLDFSGPGALGGGKISGSLRMDFFGGSGAVLDQLFRVRTATIEIRWKNRSALAGLDKPLIAPREPNSLAQVGVSPLTAAGNLWLWLPQARFEQDFHFGDSAGVRVQAGVVQTREVAGVTTAIPSYAAELESGRPGAEGRVEFFGGTKRRIEIAAGFHDSVSHIAETSAPSNVFSLDWLFRLSSPLEFTGAFYAGRNVAPLGALRQGVVVLGRGQAHSVHSRGGWGQLTWRATPRLSFNLFSGQQDDRNSDLQPGNIGKNLAFGANFFYRIAPNVLASFEASQVRTSYIESGAARNNHYDLGLAYLF